VAGRVDDVDEDVVVADGGVLREDRDAALALEVGVVECAFDDALVRAKGSRLIQQGIDQRRLAVVDVGDDGDVAAERIRDHLPRFCRSEHLPSIAAPRIPNRESRTSSASLISRRDASILRP
jgi:hypothetical protein